MSPLARSTLVLTALALAAPLAPQRVLYRSAPESGLVGREVRPAGDHDGDGVPDLAVTIRNKPNDTAHVAVVSGATGAELRRYRDLPVPGTSAPLSAHGAGDLDGDGRSELVIATPAFLDVYSGAARLRRILPAPSGAVYVATCAADDVDGDGKPDLAAVTYRSGTSDVLLYDVLQGRVVDSLAGTPNADAKSLLRDAGDLDGDGKRDLAFTTSDAGESRLHVVFTAALRVHLTIRLGGSGYAPLALAAADTTGDGIAELAVGQPGVRRPTGGLGRVAIYDARVGALDGALEPPAYSAAAFGGSVAPGGDLDRDGRTELLVGGSGEVLAFSARRYAVSRAPLWSFRGDPAFSLCGYAVCDLGDVDGDGFADAAAGCPGMGTSGSTGWLMLSNKVLADVTHLDGACGGGPFLPRLGATRPVLGQAMVVVGRDAPAGALGTLALSVRPAAPTFLGVSTCTIHFDPASWLAPFATAQPQWSRTVPIPAIPGLAGTELALQAFYGPTNGPLGFDLSNAVAPRIGY